MTWLDDARALPAAEVASRLGLTVRGRRAGPCPTCGESRTKKDRRLPVYLGNGWLCYACGGKGDVLDLVAWTLHKRPAREAWTEVRAWFGGDEADLQPIRGHGPAPQRPTPPAAAVTKRRFPPPSQLVALLRAAVSPAPGGRVWRWLESRGIRTPDRAAASSGELDPARAPDGGWPEWWPWAWATPQRWPLVVPAFDCDGRLRSLHGRAVLPSAPRKTTWPKDWDAGGLWMMSKAARRMARGSDGPAPARVLLVEGLPDYLDACSWAADDDAVLGGFSGSFSTLARLAPRIPPDCAIVDLLQNDVAGARYRREAAAALHPRILARPVVLRLVRRSIS